MNTLFKIYEDGRRRNFIVSSVSFLQWRSDVVERINKLYHKNYSDLTDEEILKYLQMSEHYEEVVHEVSGTGVIIPFRPRRERDEGNDKGVGKV